MAAARSSFIGRRDQRRAVVSRLAARLIRGEGATRLPMSMYRSRSSLHLGMPHTRSHAISEIALLSQAAHLRWNDLGALSGTPASRQRDAEGRPVYASIYFAEIAGFPAEGL